MAAFQWGRAEVLNWLEPLRHEDHCRCRILLRNRCLMSGLNSFQRLPSANPRRFHVASLHAPGCVKFSRPGWQVLITTPLPTAATMLAKATSLPRGVSNTRVLTSACWDRFHTLWL